VRVLAAGERILGLSHPHTQNAVARLAQVYEKSGQLDDTNMLKQRILIVIILSVLLSFVSFSAS
jgi:hypothetical protein